MTARLARAGALFALLYAAVAAGTAALSSRPVLPLFDGFAPPAPYNWVNPPPDRSGDNTVPLPVERDLPLGPDGTDAVGASTDDSQIIVSLDRGSVPARPPDTAVKVRLVPLDAATLGRLSDLRAVSNAYQVTLSYLPSQTEIRDLATSASVSLKAAEAADTVLYSPDGVLWQERSSQPGQDGGLSAQFESAGYFVAASSLNATGELIARGPGARNLLLFFAGVVPIAGAVLALALPSPIKARTARTVRQGTKSSSVSTARRRAQKAGRKAARRRRK